MFHKVTYKWIRKTQVIPEYVVFYKKLGGYLEFLWLCEELSGGVKEIICYFIH